MSLSKADLIGKLQTVEIIGMSTAEKDQQEITVLKVKDENQSYDVGLFGSETSDKILEKHGRKEGDKCLLDIPSSKLKTDGMVWINHPY